MPGGENRERIAIIEPRCHGVEHGSFNAALVAAILAAFPDCNVDVYGEATHLEELKQLLVSTRAGSASRLSWRPLATPPRRAAGWQRALKVRQLFAQIEREFRLHPPRSVVIATTDPFVLTLLKLRLFTRWRGLRAMAVFHEILAVLERRRQSSRRWGFVASLAMPHPRGLTYLVLAETILAHLQHRAPRMAAHAVAIELPSLLGDLPGDAGRRGNRSLRFGFVGAGRKAKGFHQFLEVARAIRQDHPEVHFEVVGSVPAGLAPSALQLLTSVDRNQPRDVGSERGLGVSRGGEEQAPHHPGAGVLPLVDFVATIRALDYIVWLGDPKHYQLVASGSLADAIALGIPVICLSGPLVDHVFEQVGEVGIRCETVADMQREILRIVTKFPEETYRRHIEALRTARTALAPEACVSQLRLALGGSFPGACPSNRR
ncbi:MAG: hypothetical protein HOP16_11855 [Acidobacteria bacterium]|nr:hypothetical protein [Acidobacteriota bacterium]